MASNEPRIVAELGRPETPEETAARKAQNSANHRNNQTLRNLILSLVATLIVVIALVAVVVRPAPDQLKPIDWHSIAAQAQVAAPAKLADPQLSSGWTSNRAELTSGGDKISTWYIGFISPKKEFVGFKEGMGTNPTWVAQQLDERAATGTAFLDGVTWDVYDHREADDVGNLAYAMVATTGDTSYLVYGTATTAEIRAVAQAVLESTK